MLEINVLGWHHACGSYNLTIPFNDIKTYYEIRYNDGTVLKQTQPFETVVHDWNNDGDVYPQYGAWFHDQSGYGEFLTPVDMIRLVIDEKATIPDISDPLAAHKAQAKAKAEEAERKAAEELAAAKAYPITFKMNKKTITVPFDTTRLDYKVDFASGRSFYQTGRFHEEYFLPDGKRVNPPVMAAWFQDSNSEPRFFTAKELVKLVASRQAIVDGIEVPSVHEKKPSRSKPSKLRSAEIEL